MLRLTAHRSTKAVAAKRHKDRYRTLALAPGKRARGAHAREVALVLPELILLQLQRHFSVGLQRRDVVLVLVQKVLDLLLVHLWRRGR